MYLYSHELKLQQAKTHLEHIKAETSEWLKQNPNCIDAKINRNKGEFIVKFIPTAEFPSNKIALLIGDCIHNIRSSLDHLVYALALRYCNNSLPEKFSETCEFPIFKQPKKNEKWKKKTGFIDPKAQEIIKGLQPYVEGNNNTSSMLWTIHELDCIDKHRRLHVIILLLYLNVFSYDNFSSESFEKVDPKQPLENGMVIARIIGKPILPKQPVDVKLNYNFQITLKEPLPLGNISIMTVLQNAIQYVQDNVFVPLNKFL